MQYAAVIAVHFGLAAGAPGALDVAVREPLDVMEAYAATGDPSAQFNLAIAYQKGLGTAKDAARAVEWYRKAAASAFPEAQFNLGVLFANGVEVPKDDKEAAKWIYAAAQNGMFEAQQILVGFYAQGRGVEKSPVKALAWDALARRTLELRTGVPAGEPPRPGESRAEGAAEAVGKDGRKDPFSIPLPPDAMRPNLPISMQKGFEDPTAFRPKADLAPLLASLAEAEAKAGHFAGATDADFQRAKAGAAAYLIPLPGAPQKAAAAPAWLREKTLSPTTLHESPLTPIPDDRTKQFPLGLHGRTAIQLHAWKHAETAHFVVHYLDDSEARQTMQYIEGAYTMATALLNLDPRRAPGRSHVFIFDGARWTGFLEKVQVMPPAPVGGAQATLAGFAYKSELYFGASTDKERREQSAKTLCHEVTHAIVSRFYPGRKPPLWMNEGFADYVAARTLATKRGQPITAWLRKDGDTMPDVDKVFTRIRYGERSAPDRIVAFYGNSERCVRTLAEKLPLETFPKFFNALVAGNEPGAALAAAYGKQCDGVAAFKTLVGAAR